MPDRRATEPAVSHGTAGQGDAASVISGVKERVSQPDLYSWLHPPPVFEWIEAFKEWKAQWLLTEPVLDELFDVWFREHWPILHNQGLRDPVADPSRWAHLFDFWSRELLILCAQDLLLPPYHTTTSVAHPALRWSPSTTTPAPRQRRRRTRNVISKRTAAEIQQACTEGEPAARDSITVMFPPNSFVSRDDLKQKPVRSAHSHRSYKTFVRLQGSRYYCRLCGPESSSWKNEKDLLRHVWTKHFNV